MESKTDFKTQAHFFKALSHPTRLLIVDTLLMGEKCVLDIQDLLKISQPNVSQHLQILKVADIVDYCQKGNLRCYFLREPEKILSIMRALQSS